MIYRGDATLSPTSAPRVNYLSWQAKGLLAWYPMAYPGSRTLFDCSGHNNHGLLDASNAPLWVSQDGRPALQFGTHGSAEKVVLPQIIKSFGQGTLWAYLRNNGNQGGNGSPFHITESSLFSVYPFSDALLYIGWLSNFRRE